MIKLGNKENCCGCTACVNICSHSAISMQPDQLGFWYPVINKEKCVQCGLCQKVCAFNKDYFKELNLQKPDVYAVRHKEMKEIEESRSGAMFVAISDSVLDKGGVVYGVGYMGHFRVSHKRASTKEERDEFRGSKYVQSDLNGIFVQVKDDLKRGLHVLFSGTPCQTSGLYSYLSLLRISMERLCIVDIICHGVPAPNVWRDYLAYVEQKQKMEVSAVNFRDKSKLGWASHQEAFTFKERVVYASTYARIFCQSIMFRHSCGICHFTNLQRPSDITIGDFWGWERVDAHFNADNKGVSLVLVNTQTDPQHCMQLNLQSPTAIHPRRDDFERDYINHGFLYVGRKYGDIGWKYKANLYILVIKRWTKSMLYK